MKKLLPAIFVTLAIGAANAQVVEPRLADLFKDGSIGVTAVAPDGHVWVGGQFDRIGTEPISNVARFKPDGTLDTAFKPTPNTGIIRGIGFDAAGRAYVAGEFTTIGGQPRPGLARFTADNPPLLDASYLPQLPANTRAVESMVRRSDGTLYAAYCLTTPTSTCGILRLDAQGAQIPGFSATTNAATFPMALSGDEQHLFVAGAMAQVNGTTIPSKGQVAKLDALTGAMDTSWIPFATGTGFVRGLVADGPGHMILAGSIPGGSDGLARVTIATPGSADLGFGPDFGPAANISVTNLLRSPDGDLIVLGGFSTVDGQSRPSQLAKLAPDGTARANWGATAPIGGTSSLSMAVSGNGAVVLPRFSIPGRPRSRLYVLDPLDGSDSGLPDQAEFSTRATIQRLLRDEGSGRVLAAAAGLEEIDGEVSASVVAFQSNLTPDAVWRSTLGNVVVLGGTVHAANGTTRLAIGGFGFVNGFSAIGLYLVDATSGHHVSWTPLAAPGVTIGTDSVRGLAVDEAGGFVYVAGISRDANNGQLPVRNLNRFSLITGLLDGSWAPSVSLGSSPVLRIEGTHLYVAGVHSAVATDNSSVSSFARIALSGNGRADPGFKPFASAVSLQAIEFSPAKIYVGGLGGFARIDRATGLVDSDWTPALQSPGGVTALSIADDGALWVGGSPTLGCGGAMVDVARIQPDGGVDPNWQIDADGPIGALLWVEGGKVLVGGSFRNVNGEPHDGLALVGRSDTIFAGEMGDPLCVRP